MLAEQVQETTGESVTLAYVDQGDAGDDAALAAKSRVIESCVVKHAEAKKGLRAFAAAVGGRTLFRLAGPLSPISTRLRTPRRAPRQLALARLRRPHD